MPVPVHELARTKDYLAVLDGHPMKFAAGERFAYCNSGYVVLALIVERGEWRAVSRRRSPARLRAGGNARHGVPALRRIARQRRSRLSRGWTACGGAMCSTCRCGATATVAYLHDRRATSVFCGARSFAGQDRVLRLGERDGVDRVARPPTARRYGLGFWLHATTDAVMLEGCDAGVSFRSVCEPSLSGHVHSDLELNGRRLADLPVPQRAARHLIRGWFLESLLELGDAPRRPLVIHVRLAKLALRLTKCARWPLRACSSSLSAWLRLRPARRRLALGLFLPASPRRGEGHATRAHRKLSARPLPTKRRGVAAARSSGLLGSRPRVASRGAVRLRLTAPRRGGRAS